MASEIDWVDVAEDVREWVEARKPKDQWAKWARLVKKKSVEHWRAEIAKDVEYQKQIAATPEPPGASPEAPEPPEPPEAPEAVFLTSKKARPTKLVKPTKDSHALLKRKQEARLQSALTSQPHSKDSSTASAARSAASARNAIRGRCAAEEAGAMAAAQVAASERIERTGLGSVRQGQKRARSSSPPPMPPLQSALLDQSLELGGMRGSNPDPLNLKHVTDIHDLRNAIRDSNEKTRVVFAPVECASTALPSFESYRSLSMDSLGDAASNQSRIDRIRQCFA